MKCLFVLLYALTGTLTALAQPGGPPDFSRQETRALSEPLTGVTTNGTVVPNLFPVRWTGVSTRPVRVAAERFIASLTPAQRSQTLFPVDDAEWRKRSNVDFYKRQGMGFADMSAEQLSAALILLKSALSAKGVKLAHDIRHLNQTLGELTGDFTRLNENLYWPTIMGTPSNTEPWGWQINGHHLVINYVVLGDQVVMTPTFMGSEPVTATSGQYAGTSILQPEQDKALAFVNGLTDAQRRKAVLDSAKTRNNILAEAFKDNVVIDYTGVQGSDLTTSQISQLLDLIGEHVGNLDEGHAKVKMADVRQHIWDTYFAWIGQTRTGSVLYYRVQSPVILIEFDHQGAVF